MNRTFTYSEFSTYKRCPMKHHFAYEELLETKGRKPALWVGTGVHEGLAAHYSGKDGVKAAATWVLDEKLRIKSENPDLWEEDAEKLNKDGDLVVAMVQGWIDHVQEKGLDHGIKVLEVEKEFCIPILTPRGNKSRAQFAGKIDGLVKWNGNYWLTEHKTAKAVGDSYVQQLKLDEQIGCYSYAIQRELDIKIAGCIYNILRKQMPGPRVKAPLFYREFVYRNEQELAEIGERLYWSYREITRPGRYPLLNPSQMACRGCPFWSLCIEDTPEARNNFVVKSSKHQELEGVI